MIPEPSRTHYFYQNLKKLLGLYLYSLILTTGFRVFFLYYFGEKDLWQNYSSDILYAFYMGWRYDTMVISYLLLIPFLFLTTASLLGNRLLINVSQFFSGLWSYLALFSLVAIMICDVGFYSYFQDRINILFFGILEDDTEALFLSIWKNYPAGWALLGLVTFLIIHFVVIKKCFKFSGMQAPRWKGGPLKLMAGIVVSVILLLGGSRGGYGQLVLAPRYGDFSQSQFINLLALNGAISFENAVKLRQQRSGLEFNMAKHMGYGDNIHKAFSDYLEIDTTPTQKSQLMSLMERKTISNPALDHLRPHVVVIIMESFGTYWNRYQSEQFNFLGDLENYLKQDLYFQNFISSDNGTIGSLMTISTNIPNRPGTRFLSESRYMQLPLRSASHVPYKGRGYETSFVYGGKLGWRDIGKYFTVQGYHHVEGESHIRANLDLKGKIGTEWGSYDEYLFAHIQKKLESAQRPQFVMALTTTNHPPFEWPEHYQPASLEIPTELQGRISRDRDLFIQRFRTFQYSNFALAEFLKKIKNSNLAQNTIIAVTGDHNFWGFMNYTDDELFEKYKVPFYIYLPESLRPKQFDPFKFGSHQDIMPTLYNLSLSKTDYLAFGRDLLAQSESFALNPDVSAGKEGIIDRKGKAYAWADTPGGKIALQPVEGGFPQLDVYIRSVLSIADFFLRSEFDKQRSAGDGGE